MGERDRKQYRRAVRILTQVPGVADRIRSADSGLEVIEIPLEGDLDPGCTGEVLFTTGLGISNLEQVLTRGIRWVHTIATGLDRFPLELIDGQVLTCSRAAGAIPISEWVFAMMLTFEKQLPQTWVHGPPERWHHASLGSLHGRTLGIIGLGGIGVAVAHRALAFGMHIIGLRRTNTPVAIADVEMTTSLESLLARADHLVLSVPLTSATRQLLDANALAAMKPGVHLVNIARGELVDQDALHRALDEGRIAQASLDVAYPEPLPAGHWLYTHPRVRFSPHVSWSMPGANEILIEMFLANLHRYLAGESLVGIVDLEAGY